jgi:hypothetical protein
VRMAGIGKERRKGRKGKEWRGNERGNVEYK